eukprot:TRINITY_DN13415_c1_g1_i5.p1 TRINITY_DN13415_c1_g1~~TRINITY_DN13415_c1_g1_i5.p1  ORF type:complete len:1320 (+),score=350.15 TRINITY_DN13415_c1_g1_i5:552-3962(+)
MSNRDELSAIQRRIDAIQVRIDELEKRMGNLSDSQQAELLSLRNHLEALQSQKHSLNQMDTRMQQTPKQHSADAAAVREEAQTYPATQPPPEPEQHAVLKAQKDVQPAPKPKQPMDNQVQPAPEPKQPSGTAIGDPIRFSEFDQVPPPEPKQLTDTQLQPAPEPKQPTDLQAQPSPEPKQPTDIQVQPSPEPRQPTDAQVQPESADVQVQPSPEPQQPTDIQVQPSPKPKQPTGIQPLEVTQPSPRPKQREDSQAEELQPSPESNRTVSESPPAVRTESRAESRQSAEAALHALAQHAEDVASSGGSSAGARLRAGSGGSAEGLRRGCAAGDRTGSVADLRSESAAGARSESAAGLHADSAIGLRTESALGLRADSAAGSFAGNRPDSRQTPESALAAIIKDAGSGDIPRPKTQEGKFSSFEQAPKSFRAASAPPLHPMGSPLPVLPEDMGVAVSEAEAAVASLAQTLKERASSDAADGQSEAGSVDDMSTACVHLEAALVMLRARLDGAETPELSLALQPEWAREPQGTPATPETSALNSAFNGAEVALASLRSSLGLSLSPEEIQILAGEGSTPDGMASACEHAEVSLQALRNVLHSQGQGSAISLGMSSSFENVEVALANLQTNLTQTASSENCKIRGACKEAKEAISKLRHYVEIFEAPNSGPAMRRSNETPDALTQVEAALASLTARLRGAATPLSRPNTSGSSGSDQLEKGLRRADAAMSALLARLHGRQTPAGVREMFTGAQVPLRQPQEAQESALDAASVKAEAALSLLLARLQGAGTPDGVRDLFVGGHAHASAAQAPQDEVADLKDRIAHLEQVVMDLTMYYQDGERRLSHGQASQVISESDEVEAAQAVSEAADATANQAIDFLSMGLFETLSRPGTAGTDLSDSKVSAMQSLLMEEGEFAPYSPERNISSEQDQPTSSEFVGTSISSQQQASTSDRYEARKMSLSGKRRSAMSSPGLGLGTHSVGTPVPVVPEEEPAATLPPAAESVQEEAEENPTSRQEASSSSSAGKEILSADDGGSGRPGSSDEPAAVEQASSSSSAGNQAGSSSSAGKGAGLPQAAVSGRGSGSSSDASPSFRSQSQKKADLAKKRRSGLDLDQTEFLQKQQAARTPSPVPEGHEPRGWG